MADMSSDRTLMALLELQADASPAQSAGMAQQPEQRGMPALDERVEMFLHAVYGSERSFTAEERAWARDRILTAMAADIAEQTTSRPASVPPIAEARTAAVRSEARPSAIVRDTSETLRNFGRNFLQAIFLPVEAFAMRGMRMAAVPVLALLLVVTVWTGIDFGPGPTSPPENVTSAPPTADAPPAMSQRTTRGLAPTQPSDSAPSPRNGSRQMVAPRAAAEEALQREIAGAESTLGPAHPEVAKLIVDLANLYQSQARYSEAEALYNRALAIREQAFGPSNSEVAQTLSQLALVYRAQGRVREAEEFSRRAQIILDAAQRR